MAQYHWEPDRYLELMHTELPVYERLQDEVAVATGAGATRILELGTGTGETARRVLERHPGGALVGVDSSAEMLAHARARLPRDVRLLESRVQDALPPGPFDLVVSALAVHHLDGPEKADLFARVAAQMAPSARFVLGDVVVPEDPADAITPLDPGYDLPSTVAEQIGWLADAGLAASVTWSHRDLAVLVARA